MKFSNIVNDFVNTTKEERKPNTIFCSELGMCMRRIFFNIKEPVEFPPETLKVFLLGNMMHDKMSEILSLSDKIEEVQSEIPATIYVPGIGLRLSGRCDDIITVDGKKYIVEKKSCSSLSYYREQNKPSEHHKLQIMAYMAAFGIHQGFLLYMNKKNFDTESFEIEFDQKTFDKELDRVKDIMVFVNNNIIPKAEAKFNKELKWQCQFCPYKERCDKIGVEERNYMEEQSD